MNIRSQITLIFFAACITTHTATGQIPAPAQKEATLITGATVHTGTGEVITDGAVGFREGKITYVGSAANANRSDFKQVIDAAGKHLYPGLILANSSLGLVEVDALRQTRDMDETGNMNPNVRAMIAYNTDSRITPTLRTNGILLVQSTPRGGLISGTSSIMKMDGWNWEDAVYRSDDGIHMNWPVTKYRGSPWRGEEGIQNNKEKPSRLEMLSLFFDRAGAYAKESKPKNVNLKLDAMRGLFDGGKTLYIHVNLSKEIVESVQFAQSKGVKKIVIVEGADAWRVADFLKQNNIPVVLRRVHELPFREDEDVDQPFKTAYMLQQAGVLYCLNYSGDMEPANARNLPFIAGTTVAYGVGKEEALQSVSLNVAKILGIDKHTGSLEVGKDATLFLSTGDALDMRTNHVEKAYINGSNIDLENDQKELYRKYAEKYGLDVKE
ncbi:MAG: amidohydrolase family protein [Flavobacteriales bacterium]|nr:amidohydrolase family protein [Flavobacteriales bacterium]